MKRCLREKEETSAANAIAGIEEEEEEEEEEQKEKVLQPSRN